MPITRSQALTLQEVHADQGCPTNPGSRRDKGPMRCRRNGRTQTWVTRPEDFSFPVKYGLRECFRVTPDWNHVHAEADCPRRDVTTIGAELLAIVRDADADARDENAKTDSRDS